MADREKVIEQLEKMRDYHRSIGNNITADIANDALELLKAQRETIDELISADKALKLLKEQEAVEPTIDEYGNKRCGSCGHKLQSIADPDLFCCKCGRKVKWND